MKKKLKLDKYERDLLESVERDEWKSTNPSPAELRKFQRIAQTGLTKKIKLISRKFSS